MKRSVVSQLVKPDVDYLSSLSLRALDQKIVQARVYLNALDEAHSIAFRSPKTKLLALKCAHVHPNGDRCLTRANPKYGDGSLCGNHYLKKKRWDALGMGQ